MLKTIAATVALIVIPSCGVVQAADGTTDDGTQWHLFSLEKAQMAGYRLLNYRDPYFAQYHDHGSGQPGETWDKGAAILWDVDVVKYGNYGLRWDNRVHGETTERQFRSTGWEYTLSLGRRDVLELYYYHHSIHQLDSTQRGTYTGFPLQNMFGILWTMYKRDDK